MSKVITFIDRCLAGSATLDDIDDYVEGWHQGVVGQELELRELLGMSKQEYARWMRNADAIADIVASRKSKHSTAKS